MYSRQVACGGMPLSPDCREMGNAAPAWQSAPADYHPSPPLRLPSHIDLSAFHIGPREIFTSLANSELMSPLALALPSTIRPIIPSSHQSIEGSFSSPPLITAHHSPTVNPSPTPPTSESRIPSSFLSSSPDRQPCPTRELTVVRPYWLPGCPPPCLLSPHFRAHISHEPLCHHPRPSRRPMLRRTPCLELTLNAEVKPKQVKLSPRTETEKGGRV